MLFGLGFGAVNPPITNTAVSGMPAAQAGVAAAIASTSRQTGRSLGVALVGALAVGTGHERGCDRADQPPRLVDRGGLRRGDHRPGVRLDRGVGEGDGRADGGGARGAAVVGAPGRAAWAAGGSR